MLTKQLIIDTNVSETRIALVEGNQVAELFIERHREKGMVGNIYKAIVTRVLPGMQSAFVDIGTERSAFLYGGDVIDPETLNKLNETEHASDAGPTASASGESDGDKGEESVAHAQEKASRTPIEKVLREGQEIVVQVAKDPLGTKGARVTMFLSIAGRYLVLMPNFSHIGISRRIGDDKERERLKEIVRQIKPEGVGVIVRTAAAGINTEHIQKDLKYLLNVWRNVKAREKRTAPPALLYQELDLILKTTRDLYSEEIKKIVIDDKEAYEKLKHFLTASIPGGAKKLELYDKPNPIFDEYGIEMDIARALSSKVWLKSGGYLVIDQAEALTAFDVNTGKFVGHLRVQDTILRTNLEAVKEICAQLRIRNIGGIIVLDLIDMERAEDREKVYNALNEELKADKAKTNVLKVSELGLVQMTRERTSESLERVLMEICPYCDGRGRVRSTITEAYNLLRDIERYSLRTGHKDIRVKVREDVRDWILEEEKQLFNRIVQDYQLRIEFLPGDLTMAALHAPPYEVLPGS